MSNFQEGKKVKFIGDPVDHARKSWTPLPDKGEIVTISEIFGDHTCYLEEYS